jgi:Predicted transcriptional regulators
LASPKGANAFRTISEAAEEVGVPQHVLRFWETKFAFITPVKRAGGRRFYRPADIAVLKAIRRLLHDEGLTIRGVQRLHKEQGLNRLLGADAGSLVEAVESPAPETAPDREPTASDTARLRAVLADLEQAKARLDAVLTR